jgi:hypothetical protein
MRSGFYRDRIFTALMLRRGSELAARMSIDIAGLKTSAWRNCRQCVYSRSEICVSREGARRHSVRRKGTLADVGVRGDCGVRSTPGLSACMQHEPWFFPLIQLCVFRNGMAPARILLEPHKLSRHFAVNAPGTALGMGDRP